MVFSSTLFLVSVISRKISLENMRPFDICTSLVKKTNFG
jgi:hypothetical protein